MNKRPQSVTALSGLLIATGVVGLAFHLTQISVLQPFQSDLAWICLIHMIAVICGAYMLRGSNWARWLALGWFAFHVIVSYFHSWQALVIHGLLFAAVATILCRPQAIAYFRARRPAAT